jgi:hypothetical protein
MIAKGLRGQEHNGDIPFYSPKLLSRNSKLLVDVNVETTICRRDFVCSTNVTS